MGGREQRFFLWLCVVCSEAMVPIIDVRGLESKREFESDEFYVAYMVDNEDL